MQVRSVTVIATAAVFLGLDAVWLTVTGPRLYAPAIGHLMSPNVDWGAAALFYLIYIGGMVFFAIAPAARIGTAGGRGALFGLVAYATYDLTSQATLRDWPWLLTGIDLCWGMFATAVACAAGAAASRART